MPVFTMSKVARQRVRTPWKRLAVEPEKRKHRNKNKEENHTHRHKISVWGLSLARSLIARKEEENDEENKKNTAAAHAQCQRDIANDVVHEGPHFQRRLILKAKERQSTRASVHCFGLTNLKESFIRVRPVDEHD